MAGTVVIIKHNQVDMDTSRPRFYKIKRFRNLLDNGLLLFGIRNSLVRYGFDIDPIYWVLEGSEKCEPPKIKGDASEYSLEYLDLEELKLIGQKLGNAQAEDMLQGFQNGQKCIGLRHKKEIAAFMFIEIKEFKYKGTSKLLKENEAYLLNMYTFDSFRGRNLAPYLRYESYRLLKEIGKDRVYSITAFFNKSSIKFKDKLKAKNLKLYLYIVLFKKYHKRINLKTYKQVED